MADEDLVDVGGGYTGIGSVRAGEAVEVGNAVRGVRPGDRLFGMIQPWRAGGACAELLRVDPGECATIPGGLGFEEAAAVLDKVAAVDKDFPGLALERGRVRVRSYIVERPVNESVTLREEHVDVQRRPGAPAPLRRRRWP
mgnify:CR=1 FL=1